MAKRESRAMRLKRQHSLEELEAMLREVDRDPDNQAHGSNGLCLLTKSAQKLSDDITWAMYYHRAPKGNAQMAAGTVEPLKNW